MSVTVPTLAETSSDFIGPLNPHVGRHTVRLAPGARAFVTSHSPLRVQRHTRGPRVYLAGRRVHHGLAFGLAALLALTRRHRRLALALGAWAATDWRDIPFRDRDNH
jgi:hypothetical protein